MGRVLAISCLVLLFATASFGWQAPLPVSKWADGADSAPSEPPEIPANRQYTTVEIAPYTSYIRYLFEHKQGVILQNGQNWFFFAYNDAQSHVSTVVLAESQLTNPASWILQDIYEWTGDGTLRYISPAAYWDGSFWYPQATFNTHAPTTDWYMIDEGGTGSGIWSNPYDVLGPVYDYYLPLTDVGPGNVVYMDGQARDVADDSHIFKSFDGWSGNIVDPPGEVMIFPADETHGPDPVYTEGLENSQLLYRDGTILIATGGYRTDDTGAPENPLLVAYKTSADGGNTWSENVWLDQAVVPDMPGSIPGIEGHYSNSFFDALIEDDGDLHFACDVVDSGYLYNESYVFGIYDIHQDNGSWTATLMCDGTYQITPDSIWDPRTELLDHDSWMHSPSLAEGTDGTLFAAWVDFGFYDPGTGDASFDVWLTRSQDGGNTWVPAINSTDTPEVDEYFARLMTAATDSFVYIVTMYGAGGIDGPLYCVQVPVDFEYVPVELSSFTADIVPQGVMLHWATQSEKDNFGFNVERADTKQRTYTRLNNQIIPGAGTTCIPQDYSYLDKTAEPGATYWYRLQDVSLAGEIEQHGAIEVTVPTAKALSLYVLGGYGDSELQFTMRFGSDGPAALKLYDLSGRLVSKLWEGDVSRGTETVMPKVSAALPEGAYVAVLAQHGVSTSQKTVLIR